MAKTKLKKPSPKPAVKTAGTETNLIWAVLGLVGVAGLSAGFTAWACSYVVSSFQDSNTMALLITDAGLKSDDKNLEANLTTATTTLLFLRDIGFAVLLGVGGVLITLGIRQSRKAG